MNTSFCQERRRSGPRFIQFGVKALLVSAAFTSTIELSAQTEPLQQFNVTPYAVPAPYSAGKNRIIKGTDHNVWFTFTNDSGGYVGQMNPQGQLLNALPTQGSPTALTNGPSGDYYSIWFIESVNVNGANVWEVGRVSATPGATPAITFETPIPYQQYAANSVAPTPNALTNAVGTQDTDNGIYLTDTSNAILWRVNPTTQNPGPGDIAWTAITIDAPAFGIGVGPDNNVWFTEYSYSQDEYYNATGYIAFITPPTSATTKFALSSFSAPATFDAITTGPDQQSVWFTQNGGGTIDSISTSAASGSSPTVEYTPAASLVNDMTLGPDFAIWFTQTFSVAAASPPALGRLALSNGVVTYSAEAVNSSATNATFVQPYGIAVGPNNNDLWFSDLSTANLGDAVIIPRLVITPVTLPNAVFGQAYQTNLVAATASGGTPPYQTWAVATGFALPAGLTLDPSTGIISGTPSGVTGTSTFNLTVMDSNGSPFAQTAAAQPFSITIAPALTITAAALPNGVIGQAYPSTQLLASGGTPPYQSNWTVVSGALPAGLALSAGGVISGMPTGPAGAATFLVTVSDSGAPPQTAAPQSFTITVVPVLTVTSTTLPVAVITQAYAGAQLQAQGGVPASYSWSLVPGSGALPAGLALSSGGAISGTPTGPAGPSSFTVSVTDGTQTATKQLSITVASILSVTEATLPTGVIAHAYAGAQLQAQGGIPASYSWSLVPGSAPLPAGLTLNATGAISGTPAGPAASSSFVVNVTDGTQTASQQFSIAIASVLTITAASLPTGVITQPYPASQLQAQGGTLPYSSWSIVSGSLPGGLTLSSTGAISGTPTGPAGSSSITVKVTDSGSPAQTASQQFSIAVNPALVITTTSPLPNGTVGLAYPGSLAAQNGTSPYSWSITAGSLPAGLALNAGSGAIAGTPSTAGTFSFTVRVTDGSSPVQTATQSFKLSIIAGLTITTTALPNGVINQAYPSTSLQAQGGTPTYSWSISAGSLPAGLSLNSSSGAISGTPSGAAGTATFTVKATDSASPPLTATQALSLSIIQSPTITTTTLSSGTVGLAYSSTLSGQNGTTPYKWSISGGKLPAGLGLSLTGTITGVPTAAGTFSFTVELTDSSMPTPLTASQPLSLSIVLGLTITTAALPNGTAGLEYSATLAGTNGTAPYKWSMSVGTLPAGLSLNPSTGVISGLPTAAGTFPLTVELTDSSKPTPLTATQALSLFINPPATQPVVPSFALTGLPASPSPGANITSATVTLSQPSSAAFAGTLTLALTPDEPGLPGGYLGDAGFVNSSGNKTATATLTIPAATTSVAFPALDPGTVAGSLMVTLTVGEQAKASTVTIEPLAPIIEAGSVQIIDVSATGFSVELVATSTPRDLKTATFTFAAAPGAQISGGSSFPVDVTSLLSSWFAGSSGLDYGGAFSLTIPFTLSGPASAIQSVSVTLTNSIGSSAAVSGTQ
jgi:hypothetical protein